MIQLEFNVPYTNMAISETKGTSKGRPPAAT